MKISLNFHRSEFACPCVDNCGCDTVDAELLSVLEAVRLQFDRPVHITSGHRCERHNADVFGRPSSLHLAGRAADIRVDDTSAPAVGDWLRREFPGRYGIGQYDSFVHFDTRHGCARFHENPDAAGLCRNVNFPRVRPMSSDRL